MESNELQESTLETDEQGPFSSNTAHMESVDWTHLEQESPMNEKINKVGPERTTEETANMMPDRDNDEEDVELPFINQSLFLKPGSKEMTTEKCDIMISYIQPKDASYAIFHPMYTIDELEDGTIKISDGLPDIEVIFNKNSVKLTEENTKK